MEERPDDLSLVGAMVWAIDYFVARDEALSDRAPRLRKAVLSPLRERAPPDLGDFEWAEIPAGSFLMGSEEGQGLNEERPRHEVTLGAFRMLTHEVTNREFRKLVSSHIGEDKLPATDVNWYEAYAYAAWLGGRLPTEAEWEYAARAGCPHEYCDPYGGETMLYEVGWFQDHPEFAESTPALQSVKLLKPNPWGLYDMFGNAWEWVADRYGRYSEETQINPWGPPIGVGRVVRGGGCCNSAEVARAAYRDGWSPEYNGDLGFRVVLPAAPSP